MDSDTSDRGNSSDSPRGKLGWKRKRKRKRTEGMERIAPSHNVCPKIGKTGQMHSASDSVTTSPQKKQVITHPKSLCQHVRNKPLVESKRCRKHTCLHSSSKLKMIKRNKIGRPRTMGNAARTECLNNMSFSIGKVVEVGSLPGNSSDSSCSISPNITPSKLSFVSEGDTGIDAQRTFYILEDVDESHPASGINKFENCNYKKLMLSLQSPLPNEHEFALNACLILSVIGHTNTEERLNVLEDTPSLLNALLAHAGFFRDCALRRLMEETYSNVLGKDVDFVSFWERLLYFGGPYKDDNQENGQMQLHQRQHIYQLLCECYPGKLAELSEQEKEIVYSLSTKNGMESHNVGSTLKCCEKCRVQLSPLLLRKWAPEDDDSSDIDLSPLPNIHMLQTPVSYEKIGRRIQLIGEILRNFSFENGNARVMAASRILFRFLVVVVQSGSTDFTQFAFDIISNIFKNTTTDVPTSYSNSKAVLIEDEPALLQMKVIMLNFVCRTFLKTNDRSKVLSCLEAISGLVMSDNRRNELVIQDQRLFKRLFELLTLLQDLILVIRCLECAVAVTSMGEVTCNGIVCIRGSLATLIALVTSGGIIVGMPHYDVFVKTIRLTAVLTLRNIVRYSSQARSELKPYELRLAEIAMSGDDASFILAQVLYYMGQDGNNVGKSIM